MLGREVAVLDDGMKIAGNHTVSFDASALSSGMYIYRIEAGSFVETRKMMLINYQLSIINYQLSIINYQLRCADLELESNHS